MTDEKLPDYLIDSSDWIIPKGVNVAWYELVINPDDWKIITGDNAEKADE